MFELIRYLEELAQITQGSIHEYNLCGICRRAGGAFQRNRHLRGFQCDGVIDTVADIADESSLVPQAVNQLRLILRQSFREIMVDTKSLRDVASGFFMVAGNDVGRQSTFTETFDQFMSFRTNAGLHFQNAGHHAINPYIDQRISQRLGSFLQIIQPFRHGEPLALHESPAAYMHLFLFQIHLDSVAHIVTGVFWRGQWYSTLPRLVGNGSGDWVGLAKLRAGRIA